MRKANKKLMVGIGIVGTVALLGLLAMGVNAQGPWGFVFIDENGNGQFDAGEWNSTAHSGVIQDAVDNASNGDTIYVWDGEYYEDVIVNKTVTIIGNTTIDAMSYSYSKNTSLEYDEFGFWIEAGNVNISGFYMWCAGGGASGIHLNNTQYCNISGNMISDDPSDGICIENSSHNMIYNNIIAQNEYGIWLINSSYNTIKMNNIYDNNCGIFYHSSRNMASWNTIIYNNISYSGHGIYLEGTDNETITGNELWYNYDGIYMGVCENISISHNNISGDDYYGYGIDASGLNNSKILYNNITAHEHGIFIEEGHNNIIDYNNIIDNRPTFISCPFVYSWNGDKYVFNADMLSGCILPVLENQDYAKLNDLQPSAGKYRIKITEELDEVSHINEVKLLAINHSADVEIIPDKEGNIHTIADLHPPISALEKDGANCLDEVIAKDGICWESNISNKNFSDPDDFYDGMILTFEKPTDADLAKIIMDYKKSMLADYMFISKYKLMGDGASEWMEELNSNSTSLQKFLTGYNKTIPNIKIWNGTGWVDKGYFISPGPWIDREMIKLVNISDIPGNTLTLWVGSLTGSLIVDYVGMDYSPDIPVETHYLPPETAMKNGGENVLPLLTGVDDNYLELNKGEYADLTFNEIQNADSYVIMMEGYYVPTIETRGTPYDNIGEKVKELAIKFLENQKSHTGIDIIDCSFITISHNNISDNDRGIYIENSDNITISYNSNIDYSNEYPGIEAHVCENLTIEKNSVSYNHYAGIWLDEVNNSTVAHNNLIENGMDEDDIMPSGIFMTDCYNVSVFYNEINCSYSSDENAGIAISGMTMHCNNTLANNTIRGYYYGIYLEGTDNETIENNDIFWNVYGVYLDNSVNNTMDGNTITNNSCGIYLLQSSYNNITDNYIAENYGDTGIYIDEDSNHTTIMYNTITRNDVGIYVYGGYEYNYENVDTQIHYNDIYGNYDYGLIYDVIQGATPYIDATYNWWGAANGPDSSDQYDPITYNYAEGEGDWLYGNHSYDNIHFDPWLGLMLYQGWNLITPAFNHSVQNASDLMDIIPHCTIVTMWDNIHQKYVSYVNGFGEDFEIDNASGYFVFVTENTNVQFFGKLCQPTINMTLYPGYNLIGWPYIMYSPAGNIADNITNCIKIAKWNAQEQTWVAEYITALDSYNFDMLMGEGAFVFVSGQSQWQVEPYWWI